MLNRRIAVLEYMATRGAPVNSLVFQNPVISVAVGNGWADGGGVSHPMRRGPGSPRLAAEPVGPGDCKGHGGAFPSG